MMKTKIFITLSFLLMFSEVPNQEIKAKMGANSDSIHSEIPVIKNPAKEVIRANIKALNDKNDAIEKEIQRTKEIVSNFKKRSDSVNKDGVKKEKTLKKEINENKRIIDSLQVELAAKDAIIVEQIYASIKVDSTLGEKLDSTCIRWPLFTSAKNKTDENCTKWKTNE